MKISGALSTTITSVTTAAWVKWPPSHSVQLTTGRPYQDLQWGHELYNVGHLLQAAIAWSSGVTTALKTDFKMKNLIGKSSGETVQLAFGGQGWVLVQPSEGTVKGAVPGGGGAQATNDALGSLLGGWPFFGALERSPRGSAP